jgi:predicted ATPase
VHFHRFMQSVHHSLRDLQGQEDPLRVIAARIAGETRLLCLDEFHITDIGDAMLMRACLEGLLSGGGTGDDIEPASDALYEHGLQRAQFVPAIELIKSHLELVELDGDADYRLRALTRAGVYHHPWTPPRSRRRRPVSWRWRTGRVKQRRPWKSKDVRCPHAGWRRASYGSTCRALRGPARYRGLHRAGEALPYDS